MAPSSDLCISNYALDKVWVGIIHFDAVFVAVVKMLYFVLDYASHS